MADALEVDNPYSHSKLAQQLEREGDFRGAEREFGRAVQAADALPLDEYRQHYDSKAAHEYAVKHAGENFATKAPVESIEQLDQAYQELLALPFLTRMQLAGFYARHQAIPEAREVCQEAVTAGLDSISLANKGIAASFERARDLLKCLSDIIGPSDTERIFQRNFEKLDRNRDGFVNEEELKRAQLDISLDVECQQMIRYLLYHYLEVEKASNDEFGMEISGITKQDVKQFQKQSKSSWKRMNKDH